MGTSYGYVGLQLQLGESVGSNGTVVGIGCGQASLDDGVGSFLHIAFHCKFHSIATINIQDLVIDAGTFEKCIYY
jgi:hypothetical protein